MTDAGGNDESELAQLRAENARLQKINRSLMTRVERGLDQSNAFTLFETGVSLETEVRQRTAALRTAMRQLSTINEELRAATRSADAANRAKSEFLARMSHEIRTPMNGVLGMTEVLLGSHLTPSQRGSMHAIQRSAESLLRIIDDILDFTKIEAGRLELETEPFALDDVLRAALEPFEELADRRGIGLRYVADPGLPAWVAGDQVRVRQIVTNLVSNALKFTSQGSVELRVERAESVGDGVGVRLVVADTGIGIPEAARERVFAAFTQADGSTTRCYGGTGLGLAIVLQLAEMMGGGVDLTSEPGVGSTFAVTLRLEPHEGPPLVPAAAPSVTVAPNLDLSILVAEDNPINVDVMVAMLDRLGCRTRVVSDGAAAVQLATTERFDAVLMDWQMPILDGLAATHAIRAFEAEHERARVPIIAVSANAMRGDKERCIAAGMDGFLSKPFRLAQLVAALGKTTAPNVGAPISGEPVDRATLLELRALDDTGAAMLRIVTRFRTDWATVADALARWVAEGDWTRLAETMHRVRSSCGYVGALRLASLCGELEATARAADRAGAEPLVAAAIAESRRVERVLASLTPAAGPSDAPAAVP